MQFFDWLSTPLIVSVGWCVACFIISLASGWHHLAGHFRATQKVEGRSFYMQTAQMNGNYYKGCLTVKTTNQGLYLSVLLPFRPAHPALLIPWSALSTFKTDKNMWLLYHITTITSPAGGKVTLGLTDPNLVKAIEGYRATYNI